MSRTVDTLGFAILSDVYYSCVLPAALSTWWNHRIMEWFALEGTLKIIQFHPPAMGTDTFH